MAYTKIHAIKATVHKAVNYICNPEKTDEKLLIDSFATSPETARYDFQHSLSKSRHNDGNLAYHLIQSFYPGEVSYEEAHQIGMELADKLLEGKYSYIVSTHIDKGHIHNHVIFSATDHINHEKYHDCKKSYYHIRELSDELCKEHNLSVITPGQNRGKKYNEWQEEKDGTTWKAQLRKDIDEAILTANSYEHFLELMEARGYEIKGADFGENALKYISFRPLERERFIRGAARSLGANYTKERLQERIAKRSKKKVPFPRKSLSPVKDYSKKQLIDTNTEKFQSSPGLQHWADIQNLKIAASSYAAADTISQIQELITEKQSTAKATRQSIVDLEHEMRDLGEILKYAEQYQDNKKFHFHYQKAKDPDTYYRRRESELRLYDGAKYVLERSGINLKNMDVEKLRSEYEALDSKKKQLQKTYKSTEKEIQKLDQNLQNVRQYLQHEIDIPETGKKQEQSL